MISTKFTATQMLRGAAAVQLFPSAISAESVARYAEHTRKLAYKHNVCALQLVEFIHRSRMKGMALVVAVYLLLLGAVLGGVALQWSNYVLVPLAMLPGAALLVVQWLNRVIPDEI